MNRRNLVKVGPGMICMMCAQFALSQATTAAPSASAPGTTAALAAFDVVSVKPVVPGHQVSFTATMGGRTVRTSFQYTADGVHWGGITVSNLIKVAYGGVMKLPTNDSVTGLPDWAKTEVVEVQGKMSDAQAAEFAKLGKDGQEEQREMMLRSLLADRFKLQVHREPKQIPDYELVLAKSGPKLKEDSDSEALLTSGLRELTAQGYRMEGLANFLGQMKDVGRMVKDKTGLPGKYSFTLRWQPDAGASAGTTDGSGGDISPSIFTALDEQLALRLQPGMGTIDTVAVDHVERPTQD